MILIKKKFLIIIILSIVCFVVQAQDDSFRAVMVYGNVQLLNKSSNAWELIKAGVRMKDSDQIKLGSDGYVGLVTSKGHTFELKKPGIFFLKQLSKNIVNMTQIPQPLIGLLDSISKELSKDNLYQENPRYRYNTIGISYPSKNSIQILSERTSFVYNDTLYLKWKSAQKYKNAYLVRLIDIFGDSLKSYLVHDTMAVISLIDTKETVWVVELSEAGKENAKISFNFRKISKESASKMTDEIHALENIMGNRASAFNTILLAYYFKKRNMNMYFYHYLDLAAKTANDIKLYQSLRKMYIVYK